MAQTIQVSIIVPVYNAGQALRRCLTSLLAQTLHEIEVICVLDCPTDGSDEIVHAFAQEDERVRVITNATNQGVAECRNIGLRAAQGEYVGFCDHDDWCEPTMFEELYSACLTQRPTANAPLTLCSRSAQTDVVFSDTFIEHLDQQEIASSPNHITTGQIIESILLPTDSAKCVSLLARSVWHSIYRRSFLQEHHITFPDRLQYTEEDSLFNLQVYAQGATWTYLPKAFYHWDLTRQTESVQYSHHDDYNYFCNYIQFIRRYVQDEHLIQSVIAIQHYRLLHDYPRTPYATASNLKYAMGKPWFKKELRRNAFYMFKFLYPRIARKLYKLTHPIHGEVWCLHRVVPERSAFARNRELELTPDYLEQLILQKKRAGYRFVSLDEMIHTHTLCNKKQINISFDDGFADVYTYAFPIFKKHHIPFTVYLTTDFPEQKAYLWWLMLEQVCHNSEDYEQRCAAIYEAKTTPAIAFQQSLTDAERAIVQNDIAQWALTWEQIQEMLASGLLTLGSHTATHPMLTKLSTEQVQQELQTSADLIEQKTGKRPTHFSYPHSAYSDIVAAQVQAAGYTTATMGYGGSIRKGDNPYCLNREYIVQKDEI